MTVAASSAACPVAIVTGASSGIGSDLARLFAADGHRLVLVARRQAELDTLADTIAATGAPRPFVLALDLARPDAPETLVAFLREQGLVARHLVNNAGFGLLGVASALDTAEQLAMIDLNVRALTGLSLAFTEDLVAQNGGILNVASLAAFLPGPGMAVYYATKAYVLSFTEALWRELGPRGVRVTALCPGPVPTGFQTRAGLTVAGLQGLMTVTSPEVARAGYSGLMAGKRLVVPGLLTKFVPLMARVLPRRMVLEIVAGNQITRLGRDNGL